MVEYSAWPVLSLAGPWAARCHCRCRCTTAPDRRLPCLAMRAKCATTSTSRRPSTCTNVAISGVSAHRMSRALRRPGRVGSTTCLGAITSYRTPAGSRAAEAGSGKRPFMVVGPASGRRVDDRRRTADGGRSGDIHAAAGYVRWCLFIPKISTILSIGDACLRPHVASAAEFLAGAGRSAWSAAPPYPLRPYALQCLRSPHGGVDRMLRHMEPPRRIYPVAERLRAPLPPTW